MNEDAEPKSVRVSPGVSFVFEMVASGITDAAKIDYADRPYQIREWVGHMEANFRTIIAEGKTTDEDATLVAVALFNPTNTAKGRLGCIKGWFHRLFYYERYSTHRLVAPVGFAMFHAWYRTSGSLEVTGFSGQHLGTKMVLFGWNYFSGLFIIAILFVTRSVTQRFPKFKEIGYGMALVVVAKVFMNFAMEWYGSVSNWLETAKVTWYEPATYAKENSLWLHLLAGGDYLLGYGVEAVVFFVVFALVLIEVFDLPKLRREKKMLQRAET